MSAPRSAVGRLGATGSHGHRCADRRMMLVVHEREVLVAVLEDTRRAALDYQSGQRQRRARELQVGLREVVEVEVTIATGPDELPWDEIALLCEQVREQPVARDVERYAEEHIGA